MAQLSSIDLRVAERLKDREFRRHWFRAVLEDDVPEKFRDLREARGLTQSELADEAEMKQSAISRFEGQRVANWKLETLLKLADALDAQLEISLVPAEEVIARYQREEAGGSSQPSSVVQASREIGHGFNDVGSLAWKLHGSWKRDTTVIIEEAAGYDLEVLSPLSGLKALAPLNLEQYPKETVTRVEPASAARAAQELSFRKATRRSDRLWS